MKLSYRFNHFLVFCLLLASLAACGQAQQNPTPLGGEGLNPDQNAESANEALAITRDPIQLTGGNGGMTGMIQNSNGALQPGTRVYFAEHTRHPDGWGVFALDTGVTKYVLIDPEGVFQADDLPPGEYVLVVGIEPESSYIISDNAGEARIYTVQAGEVLDIGLEVVTLAAYDPDAPVALPPAQSYPGPNDTPTPYP